ncbi:MAG: HD-GYP domain-containing protein [Gammaproteobacteria bacterium]|nr:HD-GYP domain-containing protein [Gammaproteobacteria bacterium]
MSLSPKNKPRPESLRKIAVADLRTGMFLNEMCGSWMDHPFWNTRFLLDNPADIESLRNSAVKEVWIDISQGLDVAEADATPPSETRAETDKRVERELVESLVQPTILVPRVELASEVKRAAALCGKAKGEVTAMFSEARMGRAVSPEKLEPLVEEISNSVQRNPGALVSLARLKSADDYTFMHSVAVCGLMIALARQLGLDQAQIREAGMAGLIHDLGKAMVPLEILNKPGKLTDEEFDRMKRHPRYGYDMLMEGAGVGEISLDVCLHHHEKVDGSGYPDRLDSDTISLFAKMGAVCDVYDAITSDRPYKSGWDPAVAIRKMNEWSKGHFDPRVFQAFVKSVGIYPIGSLVRLESGLLAVVVEISPSSLLTPSVKTFYCTRRKARLQPKVIDLGELNGRDRIKSWEDPGHWNFPDLTELWSGLDAPRAGSAA